jgi:hypothetical protein
MKRSEIRKKAKEMGYKLQFKTNSLNENLVAIGFICPETDIKTVSANVFPAEFRNKHSEIFDYLVSLHGIILEDTEQKIRTY